jgi:predicted enzyme related to lactoylglutathione lyase
MQVIRYVHTNIVALDWKSLSQFYIDVFGCAQVPPERHLSGGWIDRMTGIPGVIIDGVHLALPGYEHGPTLEIFEYKPEGTAAGMKDIDRPGFGHIAFHVDDVQAVLEDVLAHGGGQLGEVIVKDYAGLGRLTAVYARDPEGNLIEIQNWRK